MKLFLAVPLKTENVRKFGQKIPVFHYANDFIEKLDFLLE